MTHDHGAGISQRARLDRRTLTVWIEEEWLVPSRSAPELTFTEMDVARARLIRDLKDNMGVNDEGLGVILHLLDQMHALRRALADTCSTPARERRDPARRRLIAARSPGRVAALGSSAGDEA